MSARGTPDELLPEVYEELRRIAHRMHSGGVSVAPTSLVHEAWARLSGRPDIEYGRAHFVALAARAMRHILVDAARARSAAKRGGDRVRTTLVDFGEGSDPVDILALERALSELERASPRAAEVVQLRFLGGLTVEETAEALGVSPRTVRADWRTSRAWLMSRLQA